MQETSLQNTRMTELVEIKVGAVGDDNAPWFFIKDELAKNNIKITLVEFNDFFTPNKALDNGEIDLNAF